MHRGSDKKKVRNVMDDMTFEQAMKRLEEIVSKLEAGDAPLDKSMALFEEGTKLSAGLADMLDKAEQKITIIRKQNGAEEELPFQPDDEEL